MHIYPQEIADGLEQAIAANTSVAYCSPAMLHTEPLSVAVDSIKNQEVLDKVVAENKDQADLYYLDAILVSTGWNKNDDVFSPKETWAAKNTPEDKPFNYMHEEEDIIGHITGNYVADFDGNIISDDQDPPNQFNIITQAVLYKEWSNHDLRERMQRIIAEIGDGDKWFVSMECLFPRFDYALMNSKGETKIVTRSEASAFLTKHLRAYGGNGKYDDFKVGRLLRDISFSGEGLVRKPANPRSIILTDNKEFSSEAKILTVSSIKENNMSEALEKQVDVLRAELAEARAVAETINKEMAAEKDAKIAELEETIATLTAEKAQEVDSAVAASDEVKELQTKIQEKDNLIEKMKKERGEIEKKIALEKRKGQLVEAGLDVEQAETSAETFIDLSDEAFAQVVTLATKPKAEATEEEAPAEAEAAEEPAGEPAEDHDEAEASEAELENFEEDADVALAEAVSEDDPAETLRTSASEWIGSFLKHAPKEDK
jgi:hypothetical protein